MMAAEDFEAGRREMTYRKWPETQSNENRAEFFGSDPQQALGQSKLKRQTKTSRLTLDTIHEEHLEDNTIPMNDAKDDEPRIERIKYWDQRIMRDAKTHFSVITPEYDNTKLTNSSGITPEYYSTKLTNSGVITPEYDSTKLTNSGVVTPEYDSTKLTNSGVVTPEYDSTKLTNSSAITPGYDSTKLTNSSAITPGYDSMKLTNSGVGVLSDDGPSWNVRGMYDEPASALSDEGRGKYRRRRFQSKRSQRNSSTYNMQDYQSRWSNYSNRFQCSRTRFSDSEGGVQPSRNEKHFGNRRHGAENWDGSNTGTVRKLPAMHCSDYVFFDMDTGVYSSDCDIKCQDLRSGCYMFMGSSIDATTQLRRH